MTVKERLKAALANRPLTYALAAIAVIALFYYLAFRAGKKAGVGATVKYPTGSTVNPDWVKTQAPVLMLDVHEATGWFVLLSTKQQAIEALARLDDAQLVYLYNAYNQLYHAADQSKTLFTDVQDFYQVPGFRGPKEDLLARMTGLKMK